MKRLGLLTMLLGMVALVVGCPDEPETTPGVDLGGGYTTPDVPTTEVAGEEPAEAEEGSGSGEDAAEAEEGSGGMEAAAEAEEGSGGDEKAAEAPAPEPAAEAPVTPPPVITPPPVEEAPKPETP